MLGEAANNHRFQGDTVGGVEGALLDEEVTDRSVLGQDRGIHRGDQGVSFDEIVLKGIDPEQEVAVGVLSGPGLGFCEEIRDGIVEITG